MVELFNKSADGVIGVVVLAGAACGVLVGWWLRGMLGRKPNNEKPSGEPVQDIADLTDSPTYNSNGEYKMVLVVRQDLKMGKGKIAAQCAHAAVGACKKINSKDKNLLRRWEYCGQPKIVVKCQDEDELMALFHHAKAIGVNATVIQDAGRTQISAGSKTVLGIGPATEDKVNMVTGHLKLL